jgi:hypothetical protein
LNQIIVESITTSTLLLSSFSQTQVANDPTVVGAYAAATVSIVTAIVTALNQNGRLKEEREKREKLEVTLEGERQRLEADLGAERVKRTECMVEMAQLRGRVGSLEAMLRGRGFL